MKRELEAQKELATLADEFGCEIDFESTSKGHIRVIFRAGTKAAAMTVAKGHGGDRRGRLNNLARARRQLRELKGAP